jgi:hypothetical protein
MARMALKETAARGTRAPRETAHRRLVAAWAVPVVVGAGLGLRAVAAGDAAKYGGDALYTLLIVALVVLVAPSTAAWRAATVAAVISWGVEFLQLTSIPAELSQHSMAARLILGSTFNAPDLFWYVVGASAGWFAVRSADRLSARRRAG